MNFYTPLYLNEDYDQDGLADLVTIHGGDPARNPRKINPFLFFLLMRRTELLASVDEKVRLAGEILLISARTGQLLNVSIVPDQMESYYSPQLLQRSATEAYILIGTGGETHGGGLYAFDFKCWKQYCSSPVFDSKIIHSLISF